MNHTQKKLSEAGKKGQAKRIEKFKETRYELLVELSGLLDKRLLDTIQKDRSNEWLKSLIDEIRQYKND